MSGRHATERPVPGQSPEIPLGVIVIGAGQAGLSAADELVRRGAVVGEDLLVLDAEDGPGGAWRHRWDSLTIGRAHRIADLPRFPAGHMDESRPSSAIVPEYYRRYEAERELHVLRPVRSTDVPAEPLRLSDGAASHRGRAPDGAHGAPIPEGAAPRGATDGADTVRRDAPRGRGGGQGGVLAGDGPARGTRAAVSPARGGGGSRVSRAKCSVTGHESSEPWDAWHDGIAVGRPAPRDMRRKPHAGRHRERVRAGCRPQPG